MIFDTHAHYDDESFDDDRERLLAGFPAQGVHAVTNIGTNIRASEETVRMLQSVCIRMRLENLTKIRSST